MAEAAPSMADSIRAAMKEVSGKAEEEAPNEGQAGGGEGSQPEAGEGAGESEAQARARDERGRFAAGDDKAPKVDGADKPRPTLTLKEKPNAAAQPERPEGQTTPQAPIRQPEAKHVSPPPHWNGSAKIDWNKIPGSLRESIAKDYEEVGKVQALNTVLAPHAEVFAREFGGTDRALTQILGTWGYARSQPLAFVREFMQRYGIDPQSLGGVAQPVQGQPQEQLENDPYAPRFQRIETALQQIAQQPVLQQQHQINSDLQTFQTALKPDGSVAHPYYNDVRGHMAALMQTPAITEVLQSKGGAAALKEAYDQACWANPSVRDAILKERQAAQETERRQAIERAQSAAVSVSGAPGVNGAQPLAAQSVSDTLRSVYRAAKGGRA